MFKMFLLPLIVASSVHAQATVTAHVYPVTYVHVNTDREIDSNGSYSVTNTSNVDEQVTICYELTACQQWPYHVKTTKDCETVSMKPGESRSGQHDVHLPFNYNFQGWCHNQSKTQLVGAEYALSINENDFQVGR